MIEAAAVQEASPSWYHPFENNEDDTDQLPAFICKRDHIRRNANLALQRDRRTWIGKHVCISLELLTVCCVHISTHIPAAVSKHSNGYKSLPLQEISSMERLPFKGDMQCRWDSR
jgi:hypothetical protein